MFWFWTAILNWRIAVMRSSRCCGMDSPGADIGIGPWARLPAPYLYIAVRHDHATKSKYLEAVAPIVT